MRIVVIPAEEVCEVNQQVCISCDVVPLIVLVNALEAAFRLPSIHMETESDRREEVMTNRECRRGRD